MSLAPVPSLDELVADPAKAAELPAEAARTLLINLLALQPILFQRSLQTAAASTPDPPERFLTVEQVCERFGVTERWLYRHKQHLPHSQPSRKVLLFPEGKLARWFAARKTS